LGQAPLARLLNLLCTRKRRLLSRLILQHFLLGDQLLLHLLL
jgi:hypothetical protein